MKRGKLEGLTFVALITTALAVQYANAIPNLRIAVAGSDVVLTWPAESGVKYIVQYRATLSEETPWVMLSINHPAGSGETTTFIHEGAFICAPAEGNGSGGGGSPPIPGASSMNVSNVPLWDRWIYEGRAPYAWEAENRPPYPWEAKLWDDAYGFSTLSMQTTSFEGASALMSEESGCIGFYRVVKDGVRFWSLTPGQQLSGIVTLPVEVGNTAARCKASRLAPTMHPSRARIRQDLRLSIRFNSILTRDIWRMAPISCPPAQAGWS